MVYQAKNNEINLFFIKYIMSNYTEREFTDFTQNTYNCYYQTTNVSQLQRSTRPNQQSDIQRKSNQFKKQIRRQQMDEIFKQKRKALQMAINQNNISIDYQKDHQNIKFQQLLSQIQKQTNLNKDLTLLVNLMAEDNPFSKYTYPQTDTDKLCLKICHILLLNIYPSLQSNNLNDDQNRQLILKAISNMLADSKCPNYKIYPTINKFTNSVFNILTQQINEQIIEIGYLIGNLLRKNILIQPIYQQHIKQFLNWADILLNIDSQIKMLKNLIQGIATFFTTVDKFYYSEDKEASSIIQHYKTQRLLLIQSSISKHIKIGGGSQHKETLNFLNKNIEYAYLLSSETIYLLIDILVGNLKSPNCNTLITSINILIYLSYHKKTSDQVVQRLTDKYMQKFLTQLAYQATNIKILLLDLISYLCWNQYSVVQFVKNGLLNILVRYFETILDNQFYKYALHVVKKIIIFTGSRYIKQILKSIQRLADSQGPLSEEAISIIQLAHSDIQI